MTTNLLAIRRLQDAAAEAGDMMQCAICQIARTGGVNSDTYAALSGAERLELANAYGVSTSGTTQDTTAEGRAERECLRVIADAAAR